MFGCWHPLHPLCPWVTLAPASSRGISVLAHCKGAFGCDGRWGREKAWPVPWGRTELWDIFFCVLVMATIIRAVGMGTRAAGSAERETLLPSGQELSVGSPLASHPAWNQVGKSPVMPWSLLWGLLLALEEWLGSAAGWQMD